MGNNSASSLMTHYYYYFNLDLFFHRLNIEINNVNMLYKLTVNNIFDDALIFFLLTFDEAPDLDQKRNDL